MRGEPSTRGLPDERARERIRSDHDSTLFVEAAAGAGKTTALVRRVVEMVAVGRAKVSGIAAITFTEKAGGELRLRIREGLETRIGTEGRGAGDPAVKRRLEAALAHLEEASIGTIHAFCATVLEERPVEAGVDPDFGILAGAEQRTFFDQVFRRFFDRQLEAPGPGVARLLRRSRDPRQSPMDLLRDAGLRLLDYRRFDARWKRRPWDRQAAIKALARTDVEAPAEEPYGGGAAAAMRPSLASIETLYRSLPREAPGERPNWLVRSMADAADLAREIRVREDATGGDPDWVEQALAALSVPAYGGSIPPGAARELRRWRDGFRERLAAFQRESNADLAALLREDLRGLVADYEEAKRKAGMLDFDDLLLKTRDLLEGDGQVRRELRDRFRQVLVDEFQDTDPLQTEIVLLLTAADPPDGGWRKAVPIPGRLCLVGDPKQSIYRFRRADVGHYQRVRKRLLQNGAAMVNLTTNFRSTPAICRFVNRVMAPVFSEERGVAPHANQVTYRDIEPSREPMPGPSLAPIPVAASSVRELRENEPEAVAKFAHRLLESGFRVSRPDGGAPRPLQPHDICLLFRRFRSWRKLVPQPYADALQDHGVPHSLGAVQSYIGSAEFACLRAALTAIEFPDDELGVYATLRGPLFSIPDQDLFLFREGRRDRRLRPADAGRLQLADDAPPAHLAIRDGLRFLFQLHLRRNHQPIPVTLQQLLREHRAETVFAFWESPDQVFSNLRRLAESARAFEAAGGLSFRAFVEQLSAEADNPDPAASHAMDEEVGGVRLMTVHSAKGREFPVVILCDAALARTGRAQRIVCAEKKLHACDLGSGLRPWDLLEREEVEEAEDLAELDRLLYVAVTRARDLLAAPVFPEWRYPHESLLGPVSAALANPSPAGQEHLFPAEAAEAEPSRFEGAFRQRGAPQWELLTSGAEAASSSAGEAAERAFLAAREALRDGAAPRHRVAAARSFAGGEGADAVEIHTLPRDPDRPRGRAFGNLVHRVIERIPLDASEAAARLEAGQAAGALGLPKELAEPAARAVLAALAHPLLRAARIAERRGVCYREIPLLHLEEGAAGTGEARTAPADDGFETGSALEPDSADEGADAVTAETAPGPIADGPTLIAGFADLAFQAEAGGPWTVVDLKTDALEPEDPSSGEIEAKHRSQVSLYARAVARATGAPANPALLYL